MRTFWATFVVVFSSHCFSQVGIGTAAPNAALDIAASNSATPANTDGILVPHINAFPTVNPTASQQGMLVFLSIAAGGNAAGFYYWNNPTTSWIPLQSGANNTSWLLAGNSGTAASTNFIGTTDAQNLVFKRNNQRAGYISDPNTTSGERNTSFGANSLNAALTGQRNVAIGSNVMPSNTSGNTNTAVGDAAMFSNTSGQYNAAVGTGALYTNVGGSQNTALGRNAITSNASGNNNTAAGYESLYTTASGSNNTAIGTQALRANSSSGNNVAIGFQALRNNVNGIANVAIGYQAGLNETGSNKLYIENSSADASNALIYGEFDTNIARINGELQIANPSTTGYRLPTARGTNKQVLETDASGNVSWATPNNALSAVRATLSASQSLGTGGWQKVNFNTSVFDSNSEFSTSSSRFTAAKAGIYEVNAVMHTDNQSNTQYYGLGIYVNGTLYAENTANHTNNGPVSRSVKCLVSLGVGGFVEIYVQNYQSGVAVDSFPSKTYFEVRQVK